MLTYLNKMKAQNKTANANASMNAGTDVAVTRATNDSQYGTG